MSLMDAFNAKRKTPESSQSPKMTPRSSSSALGDLKFTHALIKQLDKLYGHILGNELSQAVDSSNIVGDINGIPLVRKHSWYNPGHSSVTESA